MDISFEQSAKIQPGLAVIKEQAWSHQAPPRWPDMAREHWRRQSEQRRRLSCGA